MTSPTADPPRSVRRRPLDVDLSVPDLLRALRDAPGLAVLVGSWGPGDLVVCWDPVRTAGSGTAFDLDVEPLGVPDTDFCGGWIGVWGYRPEATRLAYYDFALVRSDGEWSFNDHAEDIRRIRVDTAYRRAAGLVAAEARAYGVGTFRPTPDPAAHAGAVASVVERIAAGDIFQANVCMSLSASFSGDPLDAFIDAFEATRPAHGAFLRTTRGDIASLSPELFLRRAGRDVVTSPIKGTAPLDTDPAVLSASAKNRAENIMIVDLMRNDLSRVCEPGSVRVPESHRLERHTVWHLVSDVEGRLLDGVNDGAVLRATFPPGSVTGAPKVRAMEIIAEVEATAREAYTGALGFCGPTGMELNVLIRTFEFGDDHVRLGVGGGITIDSDPEAEVAECFAKADPLVAAVGSEVDRGGWEVTPPGAEDFIAPPRVDSGPDPHEGVYTTMLVVDGSIVDAEAHRGRLAESGAALGLDIELAWGRAEQVAAGLSTRSRLRVDIVSGRHPEVRAAPLHGTENEPWELTAMTLPDGWGRHKWRDRELIDQDYYLFVDGEGRLLESSRASVFVVRDEGVYTPPLDGRILPGTARRTIVNRLREHGIDVHEIAPHLSEIADAAEIFCTNAVRGVIPVTSVDPYGRWPVGSLTRWLAGPHRVSPTLAPARSDARVVLIDNYDSFVYNLAHHVAELGATADVIRHDAVSVADLKARVTAGELTHLIISPGPGAPRDAGISIDAVKGLAELVPVLGVCLGHQAVAEAFGAKTIRSDRPVHGHPSIIWHDGAGIYRGTDGPLVAARYHSLVTDHLPDELTVTARTADGTIMGVRHRDLPIEGIQSHPESILTRHGRALLANFLRFSTVG